MASTATGTIVAEVIPEERKGEGIGFYSMSITLATAIGPFIGLYMSQHTGYQSIFSFCLALGIISFLIAIFLNVPVADKPVKDTETNKWKLSSFIEPSALPIAFVVLIISLGYSSVLSFINFMQLKLIWSKWQVCFCCLCSRNINFTPIHRTINGLEGSKLRHVSSFFLFAAGLLLLSTAETGITLLLAGVLIGLGFGNMQSTTQAIAVKVTPPQRVGLATSTYYISLDAGLGFGPYLLGFIIPLIGYQNLYILMGVLVFLTTALYYFMHGRKESSVLRSLSSGTPNTKAE